MTALTETEKGAAEVAGGAVEAGAAGAGTGLGDAVEDGSGGVKARAGILGAGAVEWPAGLPQPVRPAARAAATSR
jgi:hypothetical protein